MCPPAPLLKNVYFPVSFFFGGGIVYVLDICIVNLSFAELLNQLSLNAVST